jgi:hypothetical protein
MPGSKPGERRGGPKKGTPNKVRTAEELRTAVEEAELKARLRMAKSGVVLPAIAKQATYVSQIKPGQRDLTDRFARIQCAIDDLHCLDEIKRERAARGHAGRAWGPDGDGSVHLLGERTGRMTRYQGSIRRYSRRTRRCTVTSERSWASSARGWKWRYGKTVRRREAASRLKRVLA